MGYALASDGRGIAYVRIERGFIAETLRVPFAVSHAFRATNKEEIAGYAALIAVARAVRRRGARSVRFVLSDERIASGATTGSAIGEELALPYVRLRCELNTFSKCEIRTGSTDDLTHRAQAEAALNLAA
ncbi:MAG: hypothetical protein JO324_04030 [Candidatus Eremiobacteraeota bacterium]|nr:hypothetical protein [Candidatus Eremiobacteraeota bacterium]